LSLTGYPTPFDSFRFSYAKFLPVGAWIVTLLMSSSSLFSSLLFTRACLVLAD